ncbi:hypothetical protein [Pyrolobus fumarii]|uniref:hypothetical protein n=1 Tax=Pyrolobus fumarii TaxID=54252 RepID=UPI00064FE552|nr:hypothetical protein [Pyrolobus fumarii]
MACKKSSIAEKLKGIEGIETVEDALSGDGVRLKVATGFALAKLPRDVLEELRECDRIEVVYPDGRVVYVTRAWVERVLTVARASGNTG